MMSRADVIRWEYDGLAAGARTAEAESANVRAARTQITTALHSFRSGWQCPAADTFFAHMDADIDPAMERLLAALGLLSEAFVTLGTDLRQTEEDAAALFDLWGGLPPESETDANPDAPRGGLTSGHTDAQGNLIDETPSVGAIVGTRAVNLRERPGAQSTFAGVQLSAGSRATVIGVTADANANGRWVLIELPNGQRLWAATISETSLFEGFSGDLDTLPQYDMNGAPLSDEEIAAREAHAALEAEFGVTLNLDADPPLTAEQRLAAIEQAREHLTALGEYNVTLTGDAWAPAEIALVRAAVEQAGATAFHHAQQLGYVPDPVASPQQAFQDVYLRRRGGGSAEGMVFERVDRATLPTLPNGVDGAYAYATATTRHNIDGQDVTVQRIQLSDASFVASNSRPAGLPFTPQQLLLHEISHFIDFQDLPGETYFNAPGIAVGRHTMIREYAITFTENGQISTQVLPQGSVVNLPTTNSGYAAAARSTNDADERYTDALMATMDPDGMKTGSDGNRAEAAQAAARAEQSDEIWRLNLESIYGPPPAS